MVKDGDYIKFNLKREWCDPPIGTQWPEPGSVHKVRKVLTHGGVYLENLVYPVDDHVEYFFPKSDFVKVERGIDYTDVMNPQIVWQEVRKE